MTKKILIFGLVVVAFLIIAPYTPLIRTSRPVKAIAVTLRLPALRINDIVMNFRDVELLAQTLKKTKLEIDDSKLYAYVLAKLKEDTLLISIASDLGVTWTDDDVDAYYEMFMRSNFPPGVTSISQVADLNDKFFRSRIIQPLLLRDVISRHLIINTANAARLEAEEAYAEIAGDPLAFDAARARITQGAFASPEPQIIFTDEELGKDNLAMLRTMDEGDITPIIAMYDGYRIYKVVHFFESPQRAWQLDEIYIPANVLNETLNEYAARSKTILYAKAYFSR